MSNKDSLIFVPITMENICLATSIEMKFWLIALTNEKVSRWNNRPLYLAKDRKDEEDGLKRYKEHLRKCKNPSKKSI